MTRRRRIDRPPTAVPACLVGRRVFPTAMGSVRSQSTDRPFGCSCNVLSQGLEPLLSWRYYHWELSGYGGGKRAIMPQNRTNHHLRKVAPDGAWGLLKGHPRSENTSIAIGSE